MQIEDGTGTGKKAKVTSDNKLRTYTTIESEISFESEVNGQSFSWSNATYNYTALDTILLVKNTSTTLDLIINSILCSGDAETEVIVHCPTCTTPTGTAVTGVNLNRKSARVAEATAKANETTNSQANVISRFRINGNSTEITNGTGSIVLGKNDCIAVDYTTVGTACNVTILGYFHTVHD